MRAALIVAMVLIAVGFGKAVAQVSTACKFKTCTGGTPVLHDDNGYRFETSSTVYPMNRTGRVIYQTCVENKSSRDFEINWYIPGPDSWLLKGCALKSPRQKIRQDTVDGYKSCLRYGNQWFPDRAEFVPHRSDLQATADEKRKDCTDLISEETRQLASNKPGSEAVETAELRQPVDEELEAFAPLDPREPSATMVHVVAHVSMLVSEDLKSFKHTVRWEVAKAYENGPTYKAGNLFFAPENASVRQTYANTFGVSADAPIPVIPEKPLTAEFNMPAHPDLASVRFRLLSSAGTPIASVFVPIWLPAQ